MNKGGEIGQKGLEILQRQLHGMEEKAEEEEEREREAVRAPKEIRKKKRPAQLIQPNCLSHAPRKGESCYEEKEKSNYLISFILLSFFFSTFYSFNPTSISLCTCALRGLFFFILFCIIVVLSVLLFPS